MITLYSTFLAVAGLFVVGYPLTMLVLHCIMTRMEAKAA